jgi:hypothetical protein
MVMGVLALLGLGTTLMAWSMICAQLSFVATWTPTVFPIMIEGGVVVVLVWITGWILRLATATVANTYGSDEAWQNSGTAYILGYTHLAIELVLLAPILAVGVVHYIGMTVDIRVTAHVLTLRQERQIATSAGRALLVFYPHLVSFQWSLVS